MLNKLKPTYNNNLAFNMPISTMKVWKKPNESVLCDSAVVSLNV